MGFKRKFTFNLENYLEMSYFIAQDMYTSLSALLIFPFINIPENYHKKQPTLTMITTTERKPEIRKCKNKYEIKIKEELKCQQQKAYYERMRIVKQYVFILFPRCVNV